MIKYFLLLIISTSVSLTLQTSVAQEEMDDEVELLEEAEELPPAQPPDVGSDAGNDGEPPQRFRPNPRFGGNNTAPSRFNPTNSDSNSSSTNSSTSFNKAVSPMAANGKTAFVDAHPEDITKQNFPDIVESFDYKDAPITDVVNAMGKLTGKRFIYSENLSGKITITSGFKITVAEAWEAFMTALASNGYTVVPSGKFLRIQKIDDAKSGTEIYSGNYYPNSDQLITRIIRLKYIDAEDASKTFDKIIKSKNGQVIPYEKTNSLIVTDLGSSVDRISRVLEELDKPGFEEQLKLIPIKNAKAKDIADLIDKIINKDQDKKKNTFRPASRFGQAEKTEALSLVTPDDRTNSIIVVGNSKGIERIVALVAQLDYPLDPSEAGGVYVYYVKHGDAKKIADTLNGIAQEQEKQATQAAPAAAPSAEGGAAFKPPAQKQKLFGGDIIIKADENTNSLIITASKQDYATLLSLLEKIDLAKDQVFVEAHIIEMDASKSDNWSFNVLKFKGGDQNQANAVGNGIGRGGYILGDSSKLTNLTSDGGIFGFGSGDKVSVRFGTENVIIPSLVGFIEFIKTNISGNVLSSPQITAMDNEEAEIEVGDQIPVGLGSTVAAGGQQTFTPTFQDATILLNIKPSISPDSDYVTLKITQKANDVSEKKIQAAQLQATSQGLKKRTIKTNLTLKSGDTAILGGLILETDKLTEKKIPFLGDIPILGWLFKSKRGDHQKTNLMVFITPKILRNTQDHKKLIKNKLAKRIDWIKRYASGRDPFGEHLVEIAKFADSPNEFQLEDQPVAPTRAPITPDSNESLELDPEELYNEEDITPTE